MAGVAPLDGAPRIGVGETRRENMLVGYHGRHDLLTVKGDRKL
jgi:hypothetical protein